MQRLLIVDDKEEERYLLGILFEKSGYHVDLAQDGVQALNIARDNPPDMIISDILMPVMDGFSLCREWRKDKRLGLLPFVFYSATYTDPRDEEFALKIGADRFIVKPMEPIALLNVVNEVLLNEDKRHAPQDYGVEDAAYFKTYSESLVRKLEDKLELFHTMFDIDPSAIFMLSPKNAILELNRAAQRLCCVKPEDALDANFADSFISDSYRIAFIEKMKAALSGVFIHDFQTELQPLRGSKRTVLWNAQRLKHSSGAIDGILLIGNDITELLLAEQQRASLETQLRQAQKMEALGAFAGGIAHDFNNILTCIIGFIDLTRFADSPNSTADDNLENALVAAFRAKDLVSQILSISRIDKETFKNLEIAPLIKETGKLLRASIPRNIELKLDVDVNCGTIFCDPGQIHQVIMNLCTNAYHAIGDNIGVIGIACRGFNKSFAAGDSQDDLPPGAYVVIEVADTGSGMSEAVMKRIFDPYFTTKEKGKGTGLGLSIVRAIVHAHRGKIYFDSAEGKGSTFRVFFPKQDTAAQAMQKIKDGKWEMGHNESVLLAENDETTGPMLAHALTAINYRVKLARDGLEALELFMPNPESFDVLVTDLTMPKMGGLELIQKARELRPDLPVTIMSANPEAISKDNLNSMGINGFLKKPFDISELSRMLKGLGKDKSL